MFNEARGTVSCSGEETRLTERAQIGKHIAFGDAAAEAQGALALGESRELQEIEAALARIGDGSYGICARCGREVGKARLKVDPTTTHCATCQAPAQPDS